MQVSGSENLERDAERACPACGGRAYVPFADERIDQNKVNDFTYASRKQPEFMCLRLVRCNSCDLVYAPTPPRKEFLSSAYFEASFDSGPEAQAAADTYATALKPYISRIATRQAAVDVGAGSGPLLPWLKDFGFDPVIGIEPSRAAIEAAPADVQPMLREGMFSPAMLTGVTPSLVCSFMTLEHVAEPGEFVREAYELLAPGGMIAVVVHNWRGGLNRLLGLRSPIIDVEHLQLFSPQSVRQLLEGAGFVSVDQTSISNAYPIRYWLRLTPLPGKLKSGLARALETVGLADRQMSFRVGNMLAVGFKPK